MIHIQGKTGTGNHTRNVGVIQPVKGQVLEGETACSGGGCIRDIEEINVLINLLSLRIEGITVDNVDPAGGAVRLRVRAVDHNITGEVGTDRNGAGKGDRSHGLPILPGSKGDLPAAEADREGDRFPERVAIFRIVAVGGHDQSGAVVSAHGVKPCPATVCAVVVRSRLCVGHEGIGLDGKPFRAVVVLEVGPFDLELESAVQCVFQFRQQSCFRRNRIFAEDLHQHGAVSITGDHRNGVGVCCQTCAVRESIDRAVKIDRGAVQNFDPVRNDRVVNIHLRA